jgi:hypothetical protein
MHALNRMVTFMLSALVLLNTLLLGGMETLAFSLWSSQRIGIGAVATAVPLAWQCTMLSG